MSSRFLVLFSTTFIISIAGFCFKRSKSFFLVQLLWLIFLTGFNSGGADFITNEAIFNSANQNINLSSEIFSGAGYAILAHFFGSLNIDFIGFNFILSTVAILLITKVIWKLSNNPNIVMSYLFIYPFVDNIIQKRWFIAMAIVIYALSQLITKEPSKKVYITYIVLVLLASSLHMAAIFFLIVLVFWILPEEIRNKGIPIAVIIELLGIRLLPVILTPFFPEGKIQIYLIEFAKNFTLFKFLFWICLQLICSILVFVMYQHQKKYHRLDELGKKILNLNIISFIILPLYYFDPVFIRYFRPILIFNYIYVSNGINRGSVIKRNELIINILQFFCCISIFIIFYSLTGIGFEQTVVPIYEKNIFFDLFFAK